MSVYSSRPVSQASSTWSTVETHGSGAWPILYGRFPRRFTIRSTPRASPTWQWDKNEMLPPSYRPYTSRAQPEISQVKKSLNRLMRPTASSEAKQNYPWTKDAKVVCNYKWSNAGIATYRDTAKCVYNGKGNVKQGTQRGNYYRLK